MQDVSGVSAASNGQYFLRSRADVQAGRAAQNNSPQILGRAADRVTFSDRLQQLARGVSDVSGALAGGAAKPASVGLKTPAPALAGLPGAEGGQQAAEAQKVTYGQADLDALIEAFGSTAEGDSFNADYDLNGDGTIDSADLNQLLANFVAEPGI